jgi:hypothetical protein
VHKIRNLLAASGVTVAQLTLTLALSTKPSLSQEFGYRELWSGYAAITTCRKGQDAYTLGPYVFVCSGYDYPYHYGEVVLSGAAYTVGGRTLVSGRLCLVGSGTCLDGEMHATAGLRSAREVTRDCRDARQQVEQSASRLDQSASWLQSCLRRGGFDDDCSSSFRTLVSEHDNHERHVRAARDACQ